MLEIDENKEAIEPRIIAYKILKADVENRRILKKMEKFIRVEDLFDQCYSMNRLVFDLLGLKKYINPDDIPHYEYPYGEDELWEMYHGTNGVVEGGIEINDYIDEIIKYSLVAE